MKLLFHVCCAPCANRPLEVLKEDGHDITGFWYNPNIHPFTEYRSRRNSVRQLFEACKLPLIERDEYGLRPFVRAVAEDICGRGIKCYEMRFRAAAQQAAEGGFDGFTSSLFISPYQNHELMNQAAHAAAELFGTRFLGQDFRPLFREGQDSARESGFYIQKYCGCIFSEQERYQKPKSIIP